MTRPPVNWRLRLTHSAPTSSFTTLTLLLLHFSHPLRFHLLLDSSSPLLPPPLPLSLHLPLPLLPILLLPQTPSSLLSTSAFPLSHLSPLRSRSLFGRSPVNFCSITPPTRGFSTALDRRVELFVQCASFFLVSESDWSSPVNFPSSSPSRPCDLSTTLPRSQHQPYTPNFRRFLIVDH